MPAQSTSIIPLAVAPAEVGALAEISRAEIDIQITTAKQYPRNPVACLRQVREFVSDPKVAAECIYTRPVGGGKFAEGPSIRFAELLASNWGNIRVGSRPIEEGKKRVKCQAVAFDLEKNTIITHEVERSIVGKNGQRYPDHLIATTIAATCSIAFRGAVERCIPRPMWEGAYQAARTAAVSDGGDINVRIKKMLTWFEEQGVDQEAVLKACGRASVESIVGEDLIPLLGLSNAIRDGSISPDDLNPTTGSKRSKKAAAGLMNAGKTLKREAKNPSDATKLEEAICSVTTDSVGDREAALNYLENSAGADVSAAYDEQRISATERDALCRLIDARVKQVRGESE